MKLINLFLASLAACTFVSCSNDDDPSAGPQEMDAYISIAAVPQSLTKAETPGQGKENDVKKLTALVFKEDGSYYMRKDVTSDSPEENLTEITDIKVKVARPQNGVTSPTTFSVYLLANCDITDTELASLGSIDNLANLKLKDISNYQTIEEDVLPMHSERLTVGGLTPFESGGQEIKNWYVRDNASSTIESEGKEVKLYRSISRIDLIELNSKFNSTLTDASFKVKKIYLANVRNVAGVLGDEYAGEGAAYYRGAPESFDVIQKLIDNTPEGYKFDIMTFSKEYNNVELNNENKNQFTNFKSYIYANTSKGEGSYQTRLIIEGEYSAFGLTPVTKYFHIPLLDKNTGENVESNKWYQITATITGEGSDRPDEILDNAYISFEVSVAPWIDVKQDEDDSN